MAINGIFNDDILQFGPWQEFERNTARLLLHAGWRSPQIVGRKGDEGADILAVADNGLLWLFQCKYSRRSAPTEAAIEEVKSAGKAYGADKLCVVTSRKPTRGFVQEMERLQKAQYPIVHYGPEKLIRASSRVPEFPPSRLDLRDYQVDAVQKLREAVLETGRGMLVLATGLGKSVVIAELVADLLADDLLAEKRVLVLAHTIPLINQLLMSFWRHLPKQVATHRLSESERPISFDGITFATIQSFANLTDMPQFDMVIVDEAHHLGSPTYTRTLDKLKPQMTVGVTATPWRADGVSISEWIGSPVFSMGIKEGLAEGWLSEVNYRIMTDNLDWRFVSEASEHGYSIGELNKRLFIPTRDEEAVREIAQVFRREDRRRGLIFSPSQLHAKQFAGLLRKYGFRAASLTTQEDRITRYKRIAQFAAGKLDCLCVVDIFNEGIDVPDVDFIVFMRVTHSRRIFVQQLGRGLRLSPNKQNVTVLDFAADIRRVHAAIDLAIPPDKGSIEHLDLTHARISFSDRSVGSFFYEWITDLGSIQDLDDEDLVVLPVLDPERFNFPDTFEDGGV